MKGKTVSRRLLIGGVIGLGALAVIDTVLDSMGHGLDPEGPGLGSLSESLTSSPITAALSPSNAIRQAKLLDPRYHNTSNDGRLTEAQLLLWESQRHKHRPASIVPRVRTAVPDGGPRGRDLRGFAHTCATLVGSQGGGNILATLFSIETGAGFRDGSAIACYNFNPGNQKNNSGLGTVYGLVDRVPSIDFYPSGTDWTDGLNRWLRLLHAAHYNKTGTGLPVGYIGAMESLRRGNIRLFNQALGTGGYARMYRGDDAMRPRFNMLKRAGLVEGSVV